MHKLTLTEFNGELAIIFPDDFLATHDLKIGDSLRLTEAGDGLAMTLARQDDSTADPQPPQA